MPGWRRGVTARGLGFEDDRDRPLLGDADHGDRGLDSHREVGRDDPPLVDHPLEGHAAGGEQLRDPLGALVAADLLVVTEGQVDRALGLKALPDEPLHGFEQADHARLVVHGAPAPDDAFADDPVEGRMRPVRLALGLHRDHVLVRRQKNRPQLRVASRPGVEKAEVRQRLALERPMGGGVDGRQVAVQLPELPRVELGAVLVGDGSKADRKGQALGQGLGIDSERSRGSRLHLARREKGRAQQHHAGEQREPERQSRQNPSHRHPIPGRQR